MGTLRISAVAAALILAVLAGLIYGAPQAATPPPSEARDRISLALVQYDNDQLLSNRPIFIFYSTGRVIFLEGGIRGVEKDPTGVPKYSQVSNIDRAALMRDLGAYSTFVKYHSDYVISRPEDPQGVVFMICEVGECKKIKIVGNPISCRRRGTDCNVSQMPGELTKAIDYLSDFVHPDAENFPLPKVEVIFTPKNKEQSNPSFGRQMRTLPIPLVDWPADWPSLPPPSGDGKYRIMLDSDKFPRLVELAKGLHVEDFGLVRDGLLVINGKTGLPTVSIPLPGLDIWLKN